MDLIEKMSVKLGLGTDDSNTCAGTTHIAPTNTCIGDANNDILRILENRNWTVLKPAI